MPDKVIGYFGCPPRPALQKHLSALTGRLVDLDVPTGAPDSGLLPVTTCRILRNIADNATALGDRLSVIVASVGEDKCDGGRFVAEILASRGFPVEYRRNISRKKGPTPISTALLPLRNKVGFIMDGVRSLQTAKFVPCAPTHGFWGVPPNDLAVLDLFPDTTHVYGWTRCVEAGVPASMELERHVDPGVPTVFFVQTFCMKQILAHELALKHGGLVVDIDGDLTKTARVKIEAFIRLKGKR
jgi:hypothetical protein